MRRCSTNCFVTVAAILGAFLLHPVAWATMVRIANLKDLVEQADRIFVGRCVSEESGRIGNIPYTAYTFQVIEPLKGVSGETVTIRQFGLARPVEIEQGLAIAPSIAGMPRYEPRQELLLFVTKESPIGLSSPAGLAQGAFWVRGTDDKTVVNGVNNRNLTSALPASWLQMKGLTPSEANQLVSHGPLDYDLFVGALRKIVQSP